MEWIFKVSLCCTSFPSLSVTFRLLNSERIYFKNPPLVLQFEEEKSFRTSETPPAVSSPPLPPTREFELWISPHSDFTVAKWRPCFSNTFCDSPKLPNHRTLETPLKAYFLCPSRVERCCIPNGSITRTWYNLYCARVLQIFLAFDVRASYTWLLKVSWNLLQE